MMITNYKYMTEEKRQFFEKHGDPLQNYTSPLINDSYHKTITFDDGAVWYENTRPVHEPQEVTVKGIQQQYMLNCLKLNSGQQSQLASLYMNCIKEEHNDKRRQDKKYDK